MRTSAQKTLVGLLATTLIACGAVANAAPKGKGGPKGPPAGPSAHYVPHHVDHHHHHPHPPIVYGGVTPVVVAAVGPDASDMTPEASVRLRNPAANRVTLKYTLDGGPVQLLAAGQSVDVAPQTVLKFSRGGKGGWATFTLADGSYKFAPGKVYWRVMRDLDPATEVCLDDAANPLPGE